MTTTKLILIQGKIEYTFEGGFGCIFSSRESGVKQGEVRAIGDSIFHAYMLTEPEGFINKRYKVSWTLPDVTIEKIREIRAKTFGA